MAILCFSMFYIKYFIKIILNFLMINSSIIKKNYLFKKKKAKYKILKILLLYKCKKNFLKILFYIIIFT